MKQNNKREKENERNEREKENKRGIKLKCFYKCNRICTSSKLNTNRGYERGIRFVYNLYSHNGYFNESSCIVCGKLDIEKRGDNLCEICKKNMSGYISDQDFLFVKQHFTFNFL